MKNLRNSVQLIGNLGRDPELKVYDKYKKATFSVATTDSYKNNKGEMVKDTQWHNVIAWGKLAELASKYLRKGSQVAIEGKLVHRAFDTGKGEKKYYTEINANDLLMLGGKPQ